MADLEHSPVESRGANQTTPVRRSHHEHSSSTGKISQLVGMLEGGMVSFAAREQERQEVENLLLIERVELADGHDRKC